MLRRFRTLVASFSQAAREQKNGFLCELVPLEKTGYVGGRIIVEWEWKSGTSSVAYLPPGSTKVHATVLNSFYRPQYSKRSNGIPCWACTRLERLCVDGRLDDDDDDVDDDDVGRGSMM